MSVRWLALSFLFLVVGATGTARASVRACVLVFERQEHAFSEMAVKRFKNKKDVKVIPSAQPLDIAVCLKEGAEKIVIVAHAMKMSPTAPTAQLAFFRPLEGEQRTAYIDKMYWAFKLESRRLENKIRQGGPRKRFMQIEKEEYDQALRDIERVRKNPKLHVYDGVSLIMPRALEVALSALPESNLKALSFMTCHSDKVQEHYSQIGEFQKQGVRLSFAPSLKKTVGGIEQEFTKFDADWIADQIQ